jgi:putative ABC transport system ATP-binding protein
VPTEAPVISCEAVSKTYFSTSARVEALKGVTASFPPGITALVGPSGSGKSSLLRILAGLDKPTSGRVLLGDRDITALSEPRLLAMRRAVVGYVFQRPADNLVPHLTVAEHIRLANHLGPGAEEQSRTLLDQLGLRPRDDHRPAALSGGEQQRAALAFALAAGPRIILADEPTAELDRRSVEDLVGLVRDLAALGVTFVIATHDPAVMSIATHVVELEHGLVKAESDAVGREEIGVVTTPLRAEIARSAVAPVLTATGLDKTYTRGGEAIHALRDVGLHVHAGELVAVVGPSGSGKTTLLNVLAGWEQPDRGEIQWGRSRNVRGEPPWSLLAVLPQKFGLLDELSVRENITYPGRLADELPSARGRVDALAGDLDLTETLSRLPTQTSVGQQQRTGLARALIMGPTVLLADEPTGHQDAGSAERIIRALREAAETGTACVIATHNLDVARECDRILEMEGGELRGE